MIQARARVFFFLPKGDRISLLGLSFIAHARHSQKEQREIFSFLHFFLLGEHADALFFKPGDLFCVSKSVFYFETSSRRGTFPSFLCVLSSNK